MERSCDACGKTYTAKRRTSRYCSGLCRTRASRAGASHPRGATLVELSAGPDPLTGSAEGATERATRLALEEAGRAETFLAAAALALARRVDSPKTDTGSATATVIRELRAVMAEATKGTAARTSPQGLRDELADRRAAQGA